MKSQRTKNILVIIFACFAYMLPFVYALQAVLSGNMAFWYDPARDFLLAWDNLQKITLIGPTSGIPGIFYGPYWIWLLSIGLLFSKDPQIVILLVVTLPYFIILPFVLWKLRSIFDRVALISLWLLFMLSTGHDYATSPWNPHPAPLLLMIMIYVALTTDFRDKSRKVFIKTFLIGILCGLILNFHISFGLGVTVGTLLFLTLYSGYYLYYKKERIYSLKTFSMLLCCYAVGVLVTFLPFFLFEARHGFNQIQTAIKVFTAKGSVVALNGLSDALILQNFFEVPAKFLRSSLFYSTILLATGIIYLIYGLLKKHVVFSQQETKLLLLLTTISCSVLFLYLTSKNPVWSYHFIGVEIIFLFLIGLVVKKNGLLRTLLLMWTLYIACLQLQALVHDFRNSKLISDGVGGKKQIVKTITEDAKGAAYTVFAYSPSIYTYEYTYLFKWLSQKDVPYDPGNSPANAKIIYIITPSTKDAKAIDFINYRAPSSSYRTVRTWQLFSDTTITKKKKI